MSENVPPPARGDQHEPSWWLGNTPARQALLLALDGIVAALALVFAMALRFEGAIPEGYAASIPTLVLVLIAARVATNLSFRLHRWAFRLSGLSDAMRVVGAGVVGSAVFVALLYFLHASLSRGKEPLPPRSVVVLEFFITTAVMGLVRYSPRLANVFLADRQRARLGPVARTVIVGAGAAGEMLMRDLQRSLKHGYKVVGFVDDDASKHGMILGGHAVLGAIDDLPDVARRQRVEAVLIAIPQLSAARIRQILNLCADCKLRFKILPVSFIDHQERGPAAALTDLTPEDLLPREPVHLELAGGAQRLQGRRVMVTGGGGSIGSELCRQLLQAGVGRLLMVDINENELYLLSLRLRREFSGQTVMAEVADIRDEARMRALAEAFRPQDVFHAAAHKHVPLMESAPGEAVKNNVLATRSLTRVAEDVGVERFVLISTDKAVRPTSVMGASKRVAEMVVRHAARRNTSRFQAVRFGNVLASAGSVVPIFREQISAGVPVTVTDPEVKRYFMTISEAVGLVLQAAYGDYGELCVLDMGEQIRIADLARHMITIAGLVPDVDVPIVYTGLRPGEKLYEELLTEEEERTTQVSRKIFTAACPEPPADLDARIERLAGAAASENGAEVVRLLRELVPTFVPPGRGGPVAG